MAARVMQLALVSLILLPGLAFAIQTAGTNATSSSGVVVTWDVPNSTYTAATMNGAAAVGGASATNYWSDPYGGTINGATSLAMSIANPTARTVTVTFSQPVDNPVLHLERLGGWAGSVNNANSSIWTLTGSSASTAVTFTRLSGNSVFAVTSNSFQRSPLSQQVNLNGDCANGNTQTACGSLQVNGMNITSLTFRVTIAGGDPAATGQTDGFEAIWSFAPARLRVEKQSVGGTGSFSFTGTNGFPAAATTVATTTINPNQSTYYDVVAQDGAISITEAAPPSAFQLTGASCTALKDGASTGVAINSTVNLGTRTVTVADADYSPSDLITCRFVNSQIPTVKIAKRSLGGTGTFGFSLTGVTPNANSVATVTSGTTVASPTVHVGSFGVAASITENSGVAGYSTAYSCIDANAVVTGNTAPITGSSSGPGTGATAQIPAANMVAGADYTCTFTNTKQAMLKVQKTALGGGPAFTFNVTGAATSLFQVNPPTNGGSVTSAPISVTPNQDVTIEEPVTNATYGAFPNGWTLYDVTCTNAAGAPTGSSLVGATKTIYANGIGGKVTGQLVPGADVTCTFTNTKNVKGTVQKIATGGNGTFSYNLYIGSSTPTGTPTTTQGITTSGGTGIFSQTFPSSGTGQFTVQEANQSGWVLTDATCTQTNPGTGSLSNVAFTPATSTTGGYVSGTVTAGAEITCVFKNTRLPQVTIAKRSIGNIGTFSFTNGTNGLPSTLSLTTTSTSASSTSGPYTVTNINSALTLTETAQSGWTFQKWECQTSSGSLVASGTTADMTVPASVLQQGSDLTCTFFNQKRATVRFAKSKVSNDAVAANVTFSSYNNLTTAPGAISSATSDNTPGTAGNVMNVSALATAVTATENLAGTGYALTSATCTDSSSTFSGNPASFSANVTSAGLVTIPAANVISGADLTCTLLNTKQGTITIIKDALPDSSDSFGYSTSGNGLSSFSLVDDGITPANRQRSFTSLTPGDYTVTENSLPAGWALTGLSCMDSVGGGVTSTTSGSTATIHLDPGETVTCTFTNSKLPTLKVRKSTLGGTDTFSFSGTNGYAGDSITTTSATGTLVDGVEQTLASASTATTLTEAALPPGWTLTDVTCTGLGTGGTATPTYTNSAVEAGHVTLNAAATAPGSNIVCTFTNTKAASLKVVKVSNGTTGTFNFSTSGGTPANFSITTTASGSGVTQQLTGLPTGTAITLSELTPATPPATKYYLTDITCVNAVGAPVSTFGTPSVTNGTTTLGTQTVTLAAGADVTCTFTNQVEGVFSVNKTTVGGSGNESFTYDFVGAPAGTTPDPLTVDTANHTGSVTAYVPHTASITYDLVERAVAGFQLTTIQCDSGNPAAPATFVNDIPNRKVTITSQPGASKTCTFTNVHKPKIRIAKKTVGGVGSFTLSGGTNGLEAANAVVLTTTSTTNPAQTATTYEVTDVTKDASITETIPAGENWSTTWECVNDAQEVRASGTGTTLTMSGVKMTEGGRDLTCTFTNTKAPKLTVIKQSEGGTQSFPFEVSGGGLASTSSFSLTTTASGAAGAVSQVIAGIQPNTTLTITEPTTLPADWSLASMTCVDNAGGATGSSLVTAPTKTFNANNRGGILSGQLVPGADVSCTFVNSANSRGMAAKVSVGGTGTFTYNLYLNTTTPDPGKLAGTYQVSTAPSGSGDTGWNTFPVVATGQFVIEEVAQSGWTLTSVSCTHENTNGGIISQSSNGNYVAATVQPGTDVKCTFTNLRTPSIIIRKQSVGGLASFGFTGGTNGLPATLTLATTTRNPISSAPFAVTDTNASATITESPIAGWTLTSVACTNSDGTTVVPTQTDATVTIPASVLQQGKDVTCLYTNTKQASLTIVKVVRNDNGGTADVSAFNLATNAGALTFGAGNTAGSDTSYTSQPILLTAGTYSLSESAVTNYTNGTWSCSGTGASAVVETYNAGSVTLADGADVTCTITNDDSNRADLSISKTDGTTSVVSGTSTTYTITVTNKGPASVSNAILKDQASAGLSNCEVVPASMATTGTVAAPNVVDLTYAHLSGSGVAIPSMAANSSLSFQVQCSVQ